MFDFLGDLLSINHYALMVVVAISALGGFIMKQMVDSLALVLLFVPAFLIGGLGAQLLFDRYDIVLSADTDANTVAVSAIGMVGGLVVMMILTRAVLSIGADR